MNPSSENGRNEGERQARRKAAMLVLAHSGTAEIAHRLETVGVPDHEDLREPENGLVMLRGRIGGDGAPFNLGEATVSRAAVRLASGEVGFGYVLGRDRQKAQMIALCDALVQSDDFAGPVEENVLAPLRAAMNASPPSVRRLCGEMRSAASNAACAALRSSMAT